MGKDLAGERGLQPSSRPDLATRPQPWPGPRPPLLSSVRGWLLVGGWGLGRWQPGLPRLCWPGAVPSPNSSEVEVAWEPGCCVQGSGAGWDRCGSRGLWNRCGSRGRQPPADTHSAVPPARPSSPPTSTRAPRRGDGTLQSQGRGAPLGRPGRGAHLCERPWQGLRRGGRRGGRGHLAPDQVCRASVLHLVR